ncbi:MAG TPA: lamin tail domain-containing protein [Poseidonia sp.]|nr:lamin tail domain-containing protein [Poseidonia sp.]
MRPVGKANLVRDERGLTAVIEFLSAFTLFLMILTAFLSLAQLQMGSNDPAVDRLDRAAAMGLDRLTSGEGWFVPAGEEGLDYANSTADWHLAEASALEQGRVQPGLISNHRLDTSKILALHEITEDGMAAGIGLSDEMSLHLSIKVMESDNNSRKGTQLFNGGTERGTASSSSTAYRSFQQDGELIQIILEVHNGGRKNNALHLNEIVARPSSGGPEWIEVYNPNDFAIALRGWSFNHTAGASSTNILLQSGVLSGKSLVLFTGDPTSQSTGNASQVIDLGQYAFLGVGQVDGLSDGRGTLSLRYTQLDETRAAEMARAEWGGDTGLFLVTGQSIQWDGSSMTESSAWSIVDTPTPGEA